MTAVSLFAGIGGFDLALARNGHQVIWANEYDKYAADIYDKHFTRRIDRRNITTVPAGDIPDHDILVGGFPCQAFSVAGQRRGFDDTRGTLFFDIARILKDKQPRYFLLENVKGLLSHDTGRTFRTIISTLDDLGYDLQWQVCNSKDFGVPQNRERVFIVGHLRGEPRPQVFPFEGDVRSDSVLGEDDQLRPKSYIATRHLGRNGRLVSSISATVQVAEVPHIIDVAYPGREPRVYTDIAPTVRDYGSGGNKMPMVLVGNIYDDKTNPQAGRIYDRLGINPALRSGSGYPNAQILDGATIRRLTPMECERLQGFPDGWTAEGVSGPISNTQRYKCLGNAVTVKVVEAIARKLAPAA